LAGGGINGGQAYGRTSADGRTLESRPPSVPDFLATVCRALGIDPIRQKHVQRRPPIRLVEAGARPIADMVG
jgi:hypothetical protein